MSARKILVVDDDPDILFLLDRSLTAEGYDVSIAEDGEKGLSLVQTLRPDMVILDIMLPVSSGLEICEKIREVNSKIYICMLTALGEDVDKVRGLDTGADDYLTKPFNMMELSARIRSVFRRMELAGGDVAAFGGVTIDFIKREVEQGGQLVEFTQREFDLLAYLVRRPGEAVSREKLFGEIWGESSDIGMRNIDNFILRIRKKLEPDPGNPVHFMTVYGYGYKFLPGED